MAKIINFFAPPSSGKTTAAIGIFHKLKQDMKLNVDMAAEFAKDLTWEGNTFMLKHQIIVSATQLYRQERLEASVDVVITDCPILLGLFYWHEDKNAKKYEHFYNLYMDIFKKKDNINFYVNRTKPYNPVVRNQSEEESIELGIKIKQFLNDENIPYIDIPGNEEGLDIAYKYVQSVI